MVRSSFVALLAAASAATAQQCNQGQKCPDSAPCCSQYGTCGVGAYCLGGCDPRSSASLNSCVPEPVCQSATYTFDNMDRITSNMKYLGDSSQTDWVSDGQPAIYDGNVLLTMPADSVGTVLASSTYLWYGNVKARLKTSIGQGVVTAFILMSDVKDEIDYEWVGTDLGTAQTNYYFQGIASYVNSANISLSNTNENFHDYEINWTPDEIQWLVDGQVGRTKKRSDTWNDTANQWDFPQTPARVQLSVWPGGAASNAPGTIQWAGGPIDWSSPLMQPQGYYYATVASVQVNCFNASSPPGTNTGTSYTYTDYRGTNDTVEDGSGSTVLKSFLGTGTDMNKGDPQSSSSGSSSTNTPNTVPGRNGQTGGSPSGADDHANSGNSSSSGVSSGSNSGGGNGNSGNGFTQGSDSSQQRSSSGNSVGEERILKGSMFAGIIAGIALLAL